jgi:hypothetical protein
MSAHTAAADSYAGNNLTADDQPFLDRMKWYLYVMAAVALLTLLGASTIWGTIRSRQEPAGAGQQNVQPQGVQAPMDNGPPKDTRPQRLQQTNPEQQAPQK